MVEDEVVLSQGLMNDSEQGYQGDMNSSSMQHIPEDIDIGSEQQESVGNAISEDMLAAHFEPSDFNPPEAVKQSALHLKKPIKYVRKEQFQL